MTCRALPVLLVEDNAAGVRLIEEMRAEIERNCFNLGLMGLLASFYRNYLTGGV